MGFNLKEHLQKYMNHGNAPRKGGCVARIDEGNDEAHAELNKIRGVLKTFMVQELPEGWELHILGCCDGTAQDQVIFAVCREMGYREKAAFAAYSDFTRIEHLTKQAAYLRFGLSTHCRTLTATIDVPAGRKVEREIPFCPDYTSIVEGLVGEYMKMVFPAA